MASQESVPNQSAHSSFSVADWRVEPDSLRLVRADSEIRLEPKVMQVLIYLAGKPGEVVSREELEASVWTGRVVGYDAVANTIIKLRKAFGDDSREPRIIETIPKTGYRLIAKVERAVPEPGKQQNAENEGGHGLQTVAAYLKRPALLLSVLLVLAAVFGLWLAQTSDKSPSKMPEGNAGGSPEQPSIAVLPFHNLDPDREYFSNGITEDLITDLSKVPGLNVVARNSVFVYKDSQESEQAIGRKLGVRYVLKGSVQRSRNRVRINVQLTSVDDGRNLWAERYDRELGDIFQIQDDLAARIVSAMEVELAPADAQRLGRNYIASVEAYDEFLKGLDYYGRRSPDASLLAKAHFSKAIELDPGFARAYAGLALGYSRDSIDGWGGPSVQESLEKAYQLVQRAMQLDPSIPQLYFVMGQVRLFQRDYTAAIKNAEHAITLNPSYADGYALLAWILHFAGRPDEAYDVMQRSIRLNPRIPAIYRLVLGNIQYARGDLKQAVETFRTGVEINPHYQQLRVWLAGVYAATGRIEDAEWEVSEILTINPTFSLKTVEEAFPFQDPIYRDRVLADLRKAGLPD